MSDDPHEEEGAPAKPVARRPAPQRPAPERPATRRERAASPPPGSQLPSRELPRWFWLLLVVWLTMVVLVVVDAVSGWGDTPEGCFSSVCSLGQGVGIISLVLAVLLGLAVFISFFTFAVGAAQGTRRAARDERERSRSAKG